MAKLTKTEIVRRYAEKNPTMTVRQMASDLDMTPAYIHQIMWTLRKRGEVPPSKRSLQTNKTITNTINEWEGKEPLAPAPVVARVKVKLNDIHPSELHVLQTKVEEQRIIIKYLEKRIEELNVRR